MSVCGVCVYVLCTLESKFFLKNFQKSKTYDELKSSVTSLDVTVLSIFPTVQIWLIYEFTQAIRANPKIHNSFVVSANKIAYVFPILYFLFSHSYKRNISDQQKLKIFLYVTLRYKEWKYRTKNTIQCDFVLMLKFRKRKINTESIHISVCLIRV